SHRLRKILATSFTDPATVEALQTLSQLYSTPQPDTAVDTADSSNDDWSESDEDTEQQYPQYGVIDETAARARKNLQCNFENKLAEESQQFLLAFGEVNQKLDDLEGLVAEMRAYCDEAEAQLKLTEAASQSLLEHAESLQQERSTRKSIVTLFLDRFTLTDDEIEALTSQDVPVGARFFLAMDKTARIRVDCRVLMSGEDGPTKAGMDIMSTTSFYLEQGYDKIYRWCTFEFRRLGSENYLEVSPTMLESVRCLSQRPELLSEALTVLSQTRQNALLNLFPNALTRGGPSGLPRPIELHAHDPIRYIGDMLAWVHQAIAAECEFFESLFGISGCAKRMVGEVLVGCGSSQIVCATQGVAQGYLQHVIEPPYAPSRPVRARDDSIVCFKVANLLQYNPLTMQRTIGDRSVVSDTLKEITRASYKVFFDTFEAQGRAIFRLPLLVFSTVQSHFCILAGELLTTGGLGWYWTRAREDLMLFPQLTRSLVSDILSYTWEPLEPTYMCLPWQTLSLSRQGPSSYGVTFPERRTKVISLHSGNSPTATFSPRFSLLHGQAL
ncbi:oligomeric complex COG6-domain-containing protein, partial [Pisolithus marmoratus]